LTEFGSKSFLGHERLWVQDPETCFGQQISEKNDKLFFNLTFFVPKAIHGHKIPLGVVHKDDLILR
jgi:hypothetical protein